MTKLMCLTTYVCNVEWASESSCMERIVALVQAASDDHLLSAAGPDGFGALGSVVICRRLWSRFQLELEEIQPCIGIQSPDLLKLVVSTGRPVAVEQPNNRHGDIDSVTYSPVFGTDSKSNVIVSVIQYVISKEAESLHSVIGLKKALNHVMRRIGYLDAECARGRHLNNLKPSARSISEHDVTCCEDVSCLYEFAIEREESFDKLFEETDDLLSLLFDYLLDGYFANIVSQRLRVNASVIVRRNALSNPAFNDGRITDSPYVWSGIVASWSGGFSRCTLPI